MAVVLNRRERVRAATVTEIKDTARRILVAEGPEGLSLRAIAREMGMTAPALYRYFPSREDLLIELIGDLYDEVADTMVAATEAAEPVASARLLASSRTFRSWAVSHPREFGLLFGSPIPGLEVPQSTEEEESPAHEAGRRFGRVFGEQIGAIYAERPFPVPADDEIDPRLHDELTEWMRVFPVPLPIGAAQVFLSCWIRLYGMVAMEVFDHLKFAVTDAEPMFEAELRDLAVKLGVRDAYRPPDPAA